MIQPSAVALINYPGHCVSTVATLKRLFELAQWNVPVYIIVDDYSEQFKDWPYYINDLLDIIEQNIPDLKILIRFFSHINLHAFEDGWYRQQFVKLHIDKFVPNEDIFVIDGDVILEGLPGPRDIPKHEFIQDDDEEFQIHSDLYKSFMLNLKPKEARIMDGNEWTFTHHAPFRWLKRRDLIGLRLYVESIHGLDFIELHRRLINSGDIVAGIGNNPDAMIMTEWDLIEAWRLHIDRQRDLQFVHWPPYPFDIVFNDVHPTKPKQYFKTFYGTDNDIPDGWLTENGIQVPDQILSKIKKLKRTELY